MWNQGNSAIVLNNFLNFYLRKKLGKMNMAPLLEKYYWNGDIFE